MKNNANRPLVNLFAVVYLSLNSKLKVVTLIDNIFLKVEITSKKNNNTNYFFNAGGYRGVFLF